ncbi:MAG TPA: patatin-like phospholipase family protein [Bacteroidia bacterium]|nr:patatin-like phospholipase family protein [Bacteroidia bacterium]
MRCTLLAFLFALLFPLAAWSQPQPVKEEKVGVVLSGGGASGLAHIGVLMALEENNIPIDYICGTSMGALIGSMYCMGYTPMEIQATILSDEFNSWANGIIDPQYVYYFKKKEDNASWITFKISPDTTLSTSLPTNLISPLPMDFALMEQTAGASAAAGYNFDSLFIPFRCVASDVAKKQSVIFSDGDLGEAVRASLSYPFYLKPIRVNGALLFDGGLYNNFPSDVMYKDFFPDFIIGSNVATEYPVPDEDNLLSQVRCMLTSPTVFDPQCENGIVIEPDADWAGLFDFGEAQRLIDSGYAACIRNIEAIKLNVNRRTDPVVLAQKRAAFKAKKPPLVYDNIEIEGMGIKKPQETYVRKILRHRERFVTHDQLKPGYFRLAADDKIQSIYPIARYNKSSGFYDLRLTIKKEKNLFTQFGGNFSNRPINMGFIGIQYNFLGNPSFSINANGYFGKLYSAAQIRTRIDFPTRLPFYVEPAFTWNRFDYYKSTPTYFVDTRPPFLVQIERTGEINLGMPVTNKARLLLGTGAGFIRYLYYQTDAFTSADTSDRTELNFFTTHLLYERNTLNRKQYASSGTYFAFNARFVQTEEFYVPGTTSPFIDAYRSIHNWLQFRVTYDTYFKEKGKWRLGFLGEVVYTFQPFLSNYTASILSTPGFQPTPDSKTLFIPTLHAHQYAAAGLKSIFVIWKNVDWRLEGYVFAPYQALRERPDHTVEYASPLSIADMSYIGMTGLVWHSPLGPVSASVNYYSSRKEPFSFLIHFGYIIYNRKALE